MIIVQDELMTPVEKFCLYELRTNDVTGARAFYTEVIGPAFWDSDVTVVPLPERAAARGAPAHWLGHIATRDVAGMADRIVALGGQVLGPPAGAGAQTRAVLRDPFGTVMALTPAGHVPGRAPVAWHLLNVHDHERACATYAALFGWTPGDAVDMGPQLGAHRLFAWDGSGRNAGSVANTAHQPHVHVHWLFHFVVDDIDAALAAVRSGGGTVQASVRTPGGDLAAGCEDAQGAAFGLFQVTPG